MAVIKAPFKVQFEEIDPKQAQALLNKSVEGNRTVSLTRAARYIEDMREGFWEVTHQGIAIDEDGNLLDGQHRLKAVIEAGVSAKFMVCYGVPRDTFWLMDGGFARNAQSFLEGRYTVPRTALARTLMRIEEFGGVATTSTVGNGRYATHRILRFLENRPDVREYGEAFSKAAVSAGMSKKFVGTSAVGLLVGGWIAGGEDADRRTQWWEDVHAVQTGAGLPSGNPVLALFNTSPVSGNMTNVNYMRAIYAAAKYRDNEEIKVIRSNSYKSVQCW